MKENPEAEKLNGNPVLLMPISALPLSEKTQKALQKLRRDFLCQLLFEGRERILLLDGIGKKACNEIEAAITQFGFEFNHIEKHCFPRDETQQINSDFLTLTSFIVPRSYDAIFEPQRVPSREEIAERIIDKFRINPEDMHRAFSPKEKRTGEKQLGIPKKNPRRETLSTSLEVKFNITAHQSSALDNLGITQQDIEKAAFNAVMNLIKKRRRQALGNDGPKDGPP